MRVTNYLLCIVLASSMLMAQDHPSIFVDLGQKPDPACSGGLDYTVVGLPDGADATLRFTAMSGVTSIPFTCVVNAEPGVLYAVTLNFVEPGSANAVGRRVFSVSMNGLTIVDRIDLFKVAGGALKFVDRSVTGFPIDGKFSFTFTTVVKSAVVSSIRLVPLATKDGPLASQANFPKIFDLTHVVAAVPGKQGDGSYVITGTIDEQVVNTAVFYNGVYVYRNADYTVMEDPDFNFIISPRIPWDGTVSVEYDKLTFPLKPAIPWCWAHVRPGASWTFNSSVTCSEAVGAAGLSIPSNHYAVPYPWDRPPISSDPVEGLAEELVAANPLPFNLFARIPKLPTPPDPNEVARWIVEKEKGGFVRMETLPSGNKMVVIKIPEASRIQGCALPSSCKDILEAKFPGLKE